jgi:hypothetical protein
MRRNKIYAMRDMNSLHERYIAPVALIFAVAALASASEGSKPKCESPWAYRGFPHGARGAIQADMSTWQGYELDTDLPKNARLRVDFTDPGGNRRVSSWMDSGDARRVEMSVGHIGTVIRTQIQAPKGAPACDTAPDTEYVKNDFGAAIDKGVTRPGGWHLEPPP